MRDANARTNDEPRIAWIDTKDSKERIFKQRNYDTQKCVNFSEIAIVGLKIALDSNIHQIRRLVWWLVLLTCFSLMLVQTHDRLQHYLATPVSTNVRYVRNDTLVFPAVTLCPYRAKIDNDTTHFDPEKLQSLYAQHFPGSSFSDPADAMYQLADIYNIKTIWDKATWDLNESMAQCFIGRGTKCSAVSEFQEIYTVLGKCVRILPPPVAVSGQFHGLYMKLCPDPSKQLVSSFYLLVDDINDASEMRVLTHGYYVEYLWNKEVSVSLKEFDSQNRPQKPCSQNRAETATRCVATCFQQEFVDKAGCRLPYMDYVNKAPYCRGSKQVIAAEEIHRDMLWEGLTWHPDKCPCVVNPCKQRLYATFADSSERGDKCARYKVFFSEMTYESTSEEFSYEIISLLCDVGGTLGLLLGASVLTMFQIAEISFWQILGCCGCLTQNRPAANNTKTGRKIRK